MPCVLDASVALAWQFEDETDEAYTAAVLRRLRDDRAIVPAVWPLEVANGLAAAERHGRISEAASAAASERLQSLPILIEQSSLEHVLAALLPIARTHSLSVYDASYLDLAMRQQWPLATLDARLRTAATRAGVSLLE